MGELQLVQFSLLFLLRLMGGVLESSRVPGNLVGYSVHGTRVKVSISQFWTTRQKVVPTRYTSVQAGMNGRHLAHIFVRKQYQVNAGAGNLGGSG